jgi:hypothetical protein
MIVEMSEPRKPDVIGSLPSTRPHRRSAKRAPASDAEPVSPEGTPKAPPRAGANPRATPRTGPRSGTPRASAQPTVAPRAGATPRAPRAAARRSPAPEPAPTPGALQTAVEAAVELTEIGLRFGAQTLRAALSRLPRP